ncbi:hypothetical protein BGX38DRAFT_1165114 [Terfezia claveryi]|nr:hypothetical protein BGX38DRAFT_1165114 [Terfezia claveryi]
MVLALVLYNWSQALGTQKPSQDEINAAGGTYTQELYRLFLAHSEPFVPSISGLVLLSPQFMKQSWHCHLSMERSYL